MIAGTAQIDARILSSLFFLGGSFVIELVSSFLIIRKDSRSWTNRAFSGAFFLLSLALLTNTLYVLLMDETLVTWLNTLAIVLTISASFMILSGSLIIYYGPTRELGMRIGLMYVLVLVISALAVFFTERWTEIGPQPGVSQFIYWDFWFTAYAVLPVFVAVLPSLIIFIKLFLGLGDDDRQYRRPFLLLIVGLAGLMISYPVLTLPHYLIFIIDDLSLMILLGTVSGIGVVSSSIIVFLGFFLRPTA